MEPLKQSLISKIKTLNETVWEHRATEPAVTDWLDNFAPHSRPPRTSGLTHYSCCRTSCTSATARSGSC